MDEFNQPRLMRRPLAFSLEESIRQASMIPWDEKTDAIGGPAVSETTTVLRLYEPRGCLAFFLKPRRVGCIDFSDAGHWKMFINGRECNKTLHLFANLLEEKYDVNIERVYKGDN
jgi:hypothetical protein